MTQTTIIIIIMKKLFKSIIEIIKK